MDLNPLSKSGYANAMLCPYRANRLKHGRVLSQTSDIALTGIVLHYLLGSVLSEVNTLEEAIEMCSTEEEEILLKNSVANIPLEWIPDRQWLEFYLEYSFSTREVSTIRRKTGDICGYMDWVGRNFIGSLFVMDFKFGWVEGDDEFERFLYIFLASLLSDEPEPVTFYRFYGRTGNVQSYTYSAEEIINDIKPYLMTEVLRIQNMEPDPNPGEHCLSYYGQPCQFIAGECPAAESLPAIIEGKISNTETGKAFLSIVKGGELTRQNIPYVFGAAQQLQGACDKVLERIREFCKENGPVTIGSTNFGWQDKFSNIVDSEFVLKQMYDTNMGFADMAKAVNISKSSLQRIPKRKYGKLSEQLIKLAVSEVKTGEKFGVIK